MRFLNIFKCTNESHAKLTESEINENESQATVVENSLHNEVTVLTHSIDKNVKVFMTPNFGRSVEK